MGPINAGAVCGPGRAVWTGASPPRERPEKVILWAAVEAFLTTPEVAGLDPAATPASPGFQCSAPYHPTHPTPPAIP